MPEGFYAGLTYIFPEATGKIKATWYSGELEIRLSASFYKHPFDLNRENLPELFVKVQNGEVISERERLLNYFNSKGPIIRDLEPVYKCHKF